METLNELKTMRFGLQKLTLLDFPGRVACTVFTCGCNFRCPFCHNGSLVGGSNQDMALSCDELFDFLDGRKKLLDGVAITGGEPLLHPGTVELIRHIREMGYAVKLDTNGSFPERLKEVLDAGIVEYVAMDIKSSLANYAAACGRSGMEQKVMKSVELLRNSGVDHEFRTTVVSGLHTIEDLREIGKLIAGAKRYFLQNFTETDDLLEPWRDFRSVEKSELDAMLDGVKTLVPAVQIRGV